MASHMWSIVQDRMKAIIRVAQYIAITTNETTIVDNCSYIVVHCYVMQN